MRARYAVAVSMIAAAAAVQEAADASLHPVGMPDEGDGDAPMSAPAPATPSGPSLQVRDADGCGAAHRVDCCGAPTQAAAAAVPPGMAVLAEVKIQLQLYKVQRGIYLLDLQARMAMGRGEVGA